MPAEVGACVADFGAGRPSVAAGSDWWQAPNCGMLTCARNM